MSRLLTLAVLLGVAGCGGAPETRETPPTSAPTTTSSTTTTEPVPATSTAEAEVAPIAGIPRYAWPYERWTRLNRKPVPPRDADPHLGTKEVFASRPARGGVYPNGTIVVKEATRPGADFVGLIAVMRKMQGADPAHNDWVFVEYTRDSAYARFGETASGAVCWSCHIGAAETDYVWIAKLGLTR